MTDEILSQGGETMDQESHSVWGGFRESMPWPIRHIISCSEPSSEHKVKSGYYRDFTRFADDCFRGFPDMASAIDFEKSLKNEGTN